ncbi:AAA family ATPase [Archangium violaceum]|uniref:AAA family ATPase n=1 Tax=Archangium violaceum TaxID=83451 RepID=UPI000698238B|nr:ATP-binding protein [Archangium violaceum]
MGTGLDEVLLDAVAELCEAARAGDASRSDAASRRLLARLRRVDPPLSRRLEAKLPWVRGKKAPAPAVPSSLASRGLLKDLSGVPEARRPVLNPRQEALLEAFVAEHQQPEALARMGLRPRNTLFLAGPPGVGKTMTAAWLARRLGVPLLQMELSPLISAYLGKTGQNLHEVFEFARRSRAIVLLDEFDAIAKRRDDPGDMGEPRRIVSVLLKEIEEWPGPSLLVAATNHLELIDPAVLRRFQLTLTVEPPGPRQVREILDVHLEPLQPSPEIRELAAQLLSGSSGSDIRHVALESRRTVALAPRLHADHALLKALSGRARTSPARRRVARLVHARFKGQVSLGELADWLDLPPATVARYLKPAP